MAEGGITVFGLSARCLFASGSSHSFISPSFTFKLGIISVVMYIILSVVTPLGGSQETKWLYKDCAILMDDRTAGPRL